VKTIIPIIKGTIVDTKCVSGKILLINLDHLTDCILVPGNPDLYYGAHAEQLDRRVCNKLSSHTTPSIQRDLPIVPNFFLEVKGLDGPVAVAGRQASYYGASGAKA
jgi:hypothetical protein